MVCLIQCRANQVGHACIHNGKLLECSALHIQHTGDERATLGYHRPAQLKVKGLPLAQFEMSGICSVILLEIGLWHTDGMMIVDAQSATHIDVLHLDVMRFKLCLQLVDAVAQSHEIAHVQYL